MGNVTIYPKGTADITVPAGQSIAISNFGGGIAQIYYLITAANAPPAFQFQQILENSSVTLGAFSAETIVRIEANNSKVIYDVGVSPDTGIGDADTLNGLPSDTTDTIDTIAARDGSGDIQANAFESTVATGTPPLTVASTTVVPNLNASQLEGHGAGYFAVDAAVAHLAGTETFTGDKTFPKLIIGSNDQSSVTDIQLDGDSNIATHASMNFFCDSDNNASGNGFFFKTNAAYGTGTRLLNLNDDGSIRLYKGPISFGELVGGDVKINFYDNSAAVYRTFKWDDTNHDWYVEDSTDTDQKLWHAGDNPSVGAGNGISGSFTTTDGKTVTVTNGIITAIV